MSSSENFRSFFKAPMVLSLINCATIVFKLTLSLSLIKAVSPGLIDETSKLPELNFKSKIESAIPANSK